MSAKVVSLKASAQEGRVPQSEFIVPSQDTKGHSARIGTRIPPGMFHEVETILSAKRFPWTTPSDFFRWAIYRGLQSASEILESGDLENTQAQVNVMLAVMREEEEAMNFLAVLDRADKTVGNLLSHGAQGPARRLVGQLIEEANKIQNDYWRGRYLSEIKRRFGYMNEGGGSGKETGSGPTAI